MSELLDLGLAKPMLAVPTIFRMAARSPAVGDGAGAGFAYVFTRELGLAVNAALATRRPLLLRGAPGSGKSTLARAIAGVAKRSFLAKVVTSDSKLDDLLWSYDHVRRLQDASDAKRKILEDHEYVEPQALWWALAPKAAMGRGVAGRALQRAVTAPSAEPAITSVPPVVLLDEIDKADPSLPNDLLVVLGEGRFRVRETSEEITAEPKRDALIVITTNEERELSRAFLRRCIVHEIPQLSGEALKAWLVTVGEAHFPPATGAEPATDAPATDGAAKPSLVQEIATLLVRLAASPGGEPPSAAEFVDLVRACNELGVGVDHAQFEVMRRLVVAKARGKGI